jgi:hypothetical protein
MIKINLAQVTCLSVLRLPGLCTANYRASLARGNMVFAGDMVPKT